MSLKIGSVSIANEVVLGPMAGVTDLAFRKICKSFGVGLLVTEMVSAKALHYGDEKTKDLMRLDSIEHPVALQIFGSDPEIMAEAACYLNDHPCDIIDINMGCPAPKIVKNGDGSALMKNPGLVKEVISKVVAASHKPVTVKFRKGWDDGLVNAVEIAKIAEASGAAAITVHGRTRDQFYSGKADYDIIRDVKQAVTIPVIGNGDVFSIEQAVRLKEHTGCDGIMVARGVQGNPWLIRQIIKYLHEGVIENPPSLEERIEIAKRHMEYLVETKGEYIATLEMRKHAAWYFKGVPHSAHVRGRVNQASSKEEILALMDSLLHC